jgi:hypothetical protein
MDEKRIDTAAEPVDHQDDEFMDTGVLHQRSASRQVGGEHVGGCNAGCVGDSHLLLGEADE